MENLSVSRQIWVCPQGTERSVYSLHVTLELFEEELAVHWSPERYPAG